MGSVGGPPVTGSNFGMSPGATFAGGGFGAGGPTGGYNIFGTGGGTGSSYSPFGKTSYSSSGSAGYGGYGEDCLPPMS